MLTDVHVQKYLQLGFQPNFVASKLVAAEEEIISTVIDSIQENLIGGRPRVYTLGLALDFTLLAQRLSNVDKEAKVFRPGLNESALFDRYTLITERGAATANTLTLDFRGKREGIRKLEEALIALFNSLNRSGYPSAYVYSTGQWHKYKDILVNCFRLSEGGRHKLCERLIELGLKMFPVNEFFGRKIKKIRTFEEIIKTYPRSNPNENGGLVFQGIANGFIAADRPHLSIISDKVRTGSARQKRFGDIDCYYGLDLELSVEVKDLFINDENYAKELLGFVNKVAANNALGLAFVREMDGDTRKTLRESGIVVLTIEDLLEIVSTWDWQKQNNATHALLHHISHVEQNILATQRLLEFISGLDSDHDALAYVKA
jgi:hypothetical protein